MKNKLAMNCENCPSLQEGIFCHLNHGELEDISEHKIINNYKKGQTLFIQGNQPSGLYCVSTGNIKLTKTNPEGKESIIRIACAGDVIGHRSLFQHGNYGATATALEDSSVCFIDKKYIMGMIESKPTVALNLIEKLSRDMGIAESKVTSYHQKNVRERLAELLLTLEESHGTKQEDGKVHINIKLTREEMATMIGTANETLIRFMTEFKENGLIEQIGKTIVIADHEKLIEWANINY
jgi:CRP-like cAMP-binding protein